MAIDRGQLLASAEAIDVTGDVLAELKQLPSVGTTAPAEGPAAASRYAHPQDVHARALRGR